MYILWPGLDILLAPVTAGKESAYLSLSSSFLLETARPFFSKSAMKPDSLSTRASSCFIFENGTATVSFLTAWAFFILVSMSDIGSVICRFCLNFRATSQRIKFSCKSEHPAHKFTVWVIVNFPTFDYFCLIHIYSLIYVLGKVFWIPTKRRDRKPLPR